MSARDTHSYDSVIADLRARRDQLDQAITALEAVRDGPPAAAAAPSQRTGPYRDMSLSEAAIAVLAARQEPMGNADIVAALQAGGAVFTAKDPLNSLNAVIARRVREVGDIVRVGRGTWGLKAWDRPADADDGA